MLRRAAINTSNRRIKGAAAAASHRPKISVSILRRQRGRPAPASQCRLEPCHAYFDRTATASRSRSSSSSAAATGATAAAADSGGGGAGESRWSVLHGGRSFGRSQGPGISHGSSSIVDSNARMTKAPASTAAAAAARAAAATTTAAARTTAAAAAAAAAAASSPVLGVAEVTVGGNGDDDSDRRYRAPDANLRGKFVLEPRPPPTFEVRNLHTRYETVRYVLIVPRTRDEGKASGASGARTSQTGPAMSRFGPIADKCLLYTWYLVRKKGRKEGRGVLRWEARETVAFDCLECRRCRFVERRVDVRLGLLWPPRRPGGANVEEGKEGSP